MSSPSRFGGVLRAILVVGLLGAIGGAMGGAFIATVLVVSGGIRPATSFIDMAQELAGAALFVGAFGAMYGVVLGPLLGWTLMRRVPVGRAIGETAFAAALGVGAAMILPIGGFAILAYPVIGAFAAALRLRYTHRKLPDRSGAPPDQLTSG